MTGPAQAAPGLPPLPPLRLVDRTETASPACATRRGRHALLTGPGPLPALAASDGPGDGDRAYAASSEEDRFAHGSGPADRRVRDRSGAWLGLAAAGLAVLAGAAATVSFSAQYQMVHAARGLPVVAALEAAIPDTAALIFASLGIAVALHGRRAVRSRLLNLASVGTSVVMNVLAAAPGWRDLAIWAMPPIAYALASDTLISVVRATAIARHQALRQVTDDEPTPLAIIGRLLLWLTRLALAPVSTLRGLRAWVLDECPVAPGHRGSRPQSPGAVPAIAAAGLPQPPPALPARSRQARTDTKTARFLALVTEQCGPLAAIPLTSVALISAQIAPQVDLNTGAARAALRAAVLDAQDGGQQ
jgi:hypothetical protein